MGYIRYNAWRHSKRRTQKKYKDVWDIMPRLYNDLFEELNEEYVDLRSDNIHELIEKPKCK